MNNCQTPAFSEHLDVGGLHQQADEAEGDRPAAGEQDEAEGEEARLAWSQGERQAEQVLAPATPWPAG
ncbi:MAG: hypothetical protein GY813_11005 [Halieaceae bacterium]|nr:hypothetical protein [Halieaceae bacterium]